MRRGAKPAKAKVEAKPSIARRARKSEGSRVRDLEKRLAEAVAREAEGLKRESEVLEQQTATAEILRVISTSPTDLQPVFQAIVESAVRLCGAQLGSMYHLDGQMIRFGAHHGFSSGALKLIGEIFPAPARLDTLAGRTILGKRVVHLPDYNPDRDVPEQSRRLAEAIGNRSILVVPMILSGNPIGAIGIGRTQPGAFLDKQVTLLQTFADQAVIAIENVRLWLKLKPKITLEAVVTGGSPTPTRPRSPPASWHVLAPRDRLALPLGCA